MANLFTTESIALSMTTPSSGGKDYLKANVYELEGVYEADGVTKKQMSISQLVMAVCLSRATELESEIVKEMNEMAKTTDELETYSNIESELSQWQKANPSATLNASDIKTDASYSNLYAALVSTTGYGDDGNESFLKAIGMSGSSWTADQVDEMMQNIEEQMDSKNTISQEQLIDIQSLTSKRDDTYSLISNVLKSLYTVMTGNVNNM